MTLQWQDTNCREMSGCTQKPSVEMYMVVNTAQCVVQCSAAQCCAVLCCAVQCAVCTAVKYSAVQCGAVRCSAV